MYQPSGYILFNYNHTLVIQHPIANANVGSISIYKRDSNSPSHLLISTKRNDRGNMKYLGEAQIDEILTFLINNPYATADDTSILFTAKFNTNITSENIIRMEDEVQKT